MEKNIQKAIQRSNNKNKGDNEKKHMTLYRPFMITCEIKWTNITKNKKYTNNKKKKKKNA
jgi:hypothetical protein